MADDPNATMPAMPPGTPTAPIALDQLKKLGKYEIERKLGAGGMGTVFLAKDTQLRRSVALKVLPQDKASNPTLVKRFKAEAQAAAQLRHDNIVTVFESGEADGYLYIAMEFVDGTDLHDMVHRRGPIPVKRSIEIMKQVASALQHASEHKIVHRDIKPSNLLVRRDGAVKVTDLGLARSVDDTLETNITRAGTTVGTVDYMAPEQARNSKLADIRSDIYSLGCTWYHMLTGKPPYPEGSLTNKLQAHAIKPLPDPRALNDQVTEGLVAVIQRMMAKKPDDRYQTPAELLTDLNHPGLTRAGISQEIFKAIGDTSEAPTVNEFKAPPKRGSSALPPPSRRKVEEQESPQESGLNTEKLKYLGIAAALICAVVGLGWMASQFGNSFDSQPLFLGQTNNPFANQDPTAPTETVAVAPVGGGPGVATAGGGTEVAPVYGTARDPSAVQSPGTAQAMPMTTKSSGNPGTGTTSTSQQGATNGGASKSSSGNAHVPAWVSATPPDIKDLAKWTVGPGATNATHFNSLDEALGRVPPQGAVIRLTSPGPYAVERNTLVKAQNLRIEGDANNPPLVVFTGRGANVAGHIHVQGSLELSDIHFSFNRSKGGVPPSALIEVEQGSLRFRSGSMTVSGDGAGNLAAIALDPSPGTPQLLIEHCLIRGECETGVDLRAARIDAVIHESLVAIGRGSAIRFSSHVPVQESTRESPARIVRGVASTLCAAAPLDFSDEASQSQHPVTRLMLVDSICSAPVGPGESVLLKVPDWLQTTVRDSIVWESAGSVYLGFKSLIDLGSKSSVRVNDADGWRLFWKEKIDPAAFDSKAWPDATGSLANASPWDFERDSLPLAARTRGSSGQPPGAPVEMLRAPDALDPRRVVAMTQRPKPPGQFPWKSDPAEFRRVDLRKLDLGQILAANDIPDGVTIEAAGYGVCTMTPVKLTGRRVRIIFLQAEGGPLRVMAKDATSKTALFEVQDGLLELVGLRWQAVEPRPNQPAWLAIVKDATLSLRQCELEGPEKPGDHYLGMVWLQSSNPNTTAPALVMHDSFLHGPAALIRSTASSGSVHIRDSVAVARGTGFDVRLALEADRPPMVFDVLNSTLSATGSIFSITAASATEPAMTPARIFVEGCVMAPPFELRAGDGAQSTILSLKGPVLERNQLEWWGTSNGVSDQIKFWLRSEDRPAIAEKSGRAAWLETWKSSGEQRLVPGLDGVILKDPLPTRREELTPRKLELHPASRASTWAAGRSIGASVIALEDHLGPDKLPPPPPPKGGPKPKPKADPKARPGTRPSF